MSQSQSPSIASIIKKCASDRSTLSPSNLVRLHSPTVHKSSASTTRFEDPDIIRTPSRDMYANRGPTSITASSPPKNSPKHSPSSNRSANYSPRDFGQHSPKHSSSMQQISHPYSRSGTQSPTHVQDTSRFSPASNRSARSAAREEARAEAAAKQRVHSSPSSRHSPVSSPRAKQSAPTSPKSVRSNRSARSAASTDPNPCFQAREDRSAASISDDISNQKKTSFQIRNSVDMNSSPRMKGLLEMDNDVRKSDKKRRVEKEASDRELPSTSTLHPVTDGIPQNAILSPNRKPAFPLASALPKSSSVTSYSSKSPSHSSTSPRKEGSSARVNRRKVGSAPHLMFPNEYSAE